MQVALRTMLPVKGMRTSRHLIYFLRRRMFRWVVCWWRNISSLPLCWHQNASWYSLCKQLCYLDDWESTIIHVTKLLTWSFSLSVQNCLRTPTSLQVNTTNAEETFNGYISACSHTCWLTTRRSFLSSTFVRDAKRRVCWDDVRHRSIRLSSAFIIPPG